MSSTTNFMEIRKLSSENEPRDADTLSSAKRRPRIPRKLLIDLKPLNLNQIKKEIEAEKNSTVNFAFDENEISSENVAEFESSESDDGVLKDISNYMEVEEECEGAESMLRLTEKRIATSFKTFRQASERSTEILPLKTQSNDSFDLDFSALALTTPVKQKETTFMTPRVDKLPVIQEEKRAHKFDSFVTPKVNNSLSSRPQSTMPSFATPLHSTKPSFVTPLHSTKPSLVTPLHSTQNNRVRAVTPFGSETEISTRKAINVLYSMPTVSMRDETFNKIVVKHVPYLILGLLGRGGSSEVFQCYNLENKKLVAIKSVSLQNSESASGYINEVELLQQLQDCDKIIKMYDYEIIDSEKKLYVVLEKGGDDLSTILKKLATKRDHIPIYMLLFYWMDMLYAVKQIHSHGVIHSDLKPSNFIKADGGLKLIDFGIASSVQNEETSILKINPEGSCNYISPEAIRKDTSMNIDSPSYGQVRYKIHYKSDVWSLGCILYQLVYKRTPFHHIGPMYTKLAYIQDPEHIIEYPHANWVPARIINSIQKCLQYNVKSRPSVQQLIEEYEAKLLNI